MKQFSLITLSYAVVIQRTAIEKQDQSTTAPCWPRRKRAHTRRAFAATEFIEHLKGKENMPSLQTALPPELANNVIRLFRECLRRSRFIGLQQHNTQLVVDMVRQQFRKHMHETDPEKIQKLKDDAARGLINHILYESEKMTGRKFSSNF
ncbi:hypothetical protein NE237_032933 [Protea cynaroides]|uniref:Complex 1 LYR protein domain-containing protein n=1 Tax=Protea cynaroides TaxID=273540 RepID=A0A9Q0L4X7_9MAGN|nr:hypothetical protein NE237_032933 [Protea cynaroides]